MALQPLEEFQEVFPRATVELEIAPALDICTILRDQNYDMAIGPLTTIPRDLLVDRLYEDDPVFFVPPDSKFARKQAVSREDVRDETFIGRFTLPFWATLWEELAGGPLLPIAEQFRSFVIGRTRR